MSTIVKHVVIDKLWDYKSISIDMYEDVNILIGSNGTSKTTVLRIIEAILKLDMKTHSFNWKVLLLEKMLRWPTLFILRKQ